MALREQRTISAVFVKSILEKAPLSTEEKGRLLQRCDIPVSALHGGRSRVTPAQFARLSQVVTDATQDVAMGHYQNRLKPGVVHTMARYTRDADTLLQGVSRNVEFYNLFDSGFQLSLHQRDNFAFYRMEAEPGFEMTPWVCEHHLMVNHRFFCWLTGTPIPLLRVNLPYPEPEHVGEYHHLFHCEPRFNHGNAEIIFERRMLGLPILRERVELEDYLTRIPYEFLQIPSRDSSYTEQIRRYLKNALPHSPSYEQVAASLNIAPQTLRRRLANEGCDYRQIKNELLRDLAISLLSETEQDVKGIAYRLGFSEPSAFIRSFKRWTGSTPNNYRQDNQ